MSSSSNCNKRRKVSHVYGYVEYTIRDFNDIVQQYEREKRFESEPIMAFGYPLKIRICLPDDYSNNNISAYTCPKVDVDIHCHLIKKTWLHSSSDADVKVGDVKGTSIFVKDVSHNWDEDGSLSIIASLSMPRDYSWAPEKLQQQPFLTELYLQKDNTDVCFVVKNKEFNAHKIVLRQRSKILHSMIEGSTDGKVFPIHDVREEIFEAMLEYVYTVKTPPFNKIDDIKGILVAADKFGLTDLKLLVEYNLAGKMLHTENVIDLFILANSHSCSLLKEDSMKLFVSNADKIMDSDDWKLIQESPELLEELLRFLAVTSKSIIRTNNVTPENVNDADIRSLRNASMKANLEIDGSREMLISRLSDHMK